MVPDDPNGPRLVVTEPAGQAGLVLSLSAPEMVIGHSETADLILEDRFVSRRHALVTVEGSGTATIRDLNSTGGTFVNGERLAGPRVLNPGDLVQFADLVARFEPGIGPAAATTSAATAVTRILAGPSGPSGSAAAAADAGGTEAAGPAAPPGAGEAAGPVLPPGGIGGPGRPLPGTAPGRAGPAAYTVTGTVRSPALPGAGGLTVRLVDKNVGGDQVLASTQTSTDGSYAFSQLVISADYLARHHKARPDFQVQVSAAGAALASSAVRYSAPAAVTLDVVLPAGAQGLPSEYETLTANLSAVYPGSLGALREEAGRQDITYLANKTGWDARAVALAALADQFSRITAPAPVGETDPRQTQVWPVPAVSVRPEFYYALFRAGLPAHADSLFRASPATVGAIWQHSITSGVLPRALADDVPGAVASFQAISAAHSLTAAPPAGSSTLGEMLAPTLPEAAQQERFARIYAQHSGDWPKFWPALDQALGTEPARQLRLLGQLYYLTVNNQPLVAALTQAEAASPLTAAGDLASRGYYDPARWAPLIGAAIPADIPGASADEQAANYARLLAAQVRIAFPTAVLADQVSRGGMPVAGPPDLAAGVAEFLTSNAGQFEIGIEPVQGYIARTGLTDTPADVIAAVQRLQRAYQLSPDDTSLAVLLRHNLDSAFAITRYDQAGFARSFGDELGGADTAFAIHARARQIFASVLSVAVAYLGGRVAPALGGASPVQYGFPPQSAAPAYPVTAYPTLEDLFGSLDYCDCSECGSILSPAAYLVDLLNYIDQPAPPAGDNPQDALLQRRPDLQYLPLTCENTNTALPYIDIVNETLEYFVANGLSLANYTGHDTGDAVTSAELIASPQYVNDAAYAILRDAFFPPPLPFNRALELLRLQLSSLGVALPDAMAALRASEALVDHATPTSFGWSDILIERLAISRDEYRLFTDPALALGDLYGLPNATALSTLQAMSLQDFSRRLGVSCDDLASIASTRFINPNAALIPRLRQLNAPFATLRALHDNLSTPASIEAEFISALPAGLDATQYGGTSPTDYAAVVSWVTSPAVYPLIMGIITITNPAGNPDDCSPAALALRYGNPDDSANLLSGTDFTKLIRFIRLWRKLTPLLGYADAALAIERTDDILIALYPAADIVTGGSDPASDPVSRPLLDAGFRTLLLRLGCLAQVMNLLSVNTDDALVRLLACWAPIGTAGANALYQAMFLTPTLTQQDPGAQTATVASTVNVGDVLRTSINGIQVTPHAVAAGESAAAVAAAIASGINATTDLDPVSGLPLNSRFYASSAGGTVTIIAGFTLACSQSAGATESYAPSAGPPVSRSATVAGPVTPGDTLITALDTVAIAYTVVAGDTTTTIAAGIAAAINATTISDPFSGLPLNSLVVASSAAAVVTVIAANAGPPFTLACSLDPANAGAYSVRRVRPPVRPPGPLRPPVWPVRPPVRPVQALSAVATVAGTIPAGVTLTTTVNTMPLAYLTAPGDTPASIAASIAALINATAAPDPVTGLPLNAVVAASAAGAMITITATSPATPFTLTTSMTAGGYTAGQRLAPFADDGYGDFLADPSQTLFGHEPALCAACNLTGAEFALITTALGFDSSTPLTLANVSALLRCGWLAHKLGLSVLEFLRLRQLTGLDPFAPLDPPATTPAEPPVIRFIRLLGALATAGLSTEQALYLIWNSDISGISAPSDATVTGLASALRTSFAAVEAEFSLQDDPDGSIAQGLMTLVYGSSASGFFFGLLNETFSTSVPYSAPPGPPLPPGQPTLPQAVLAASAGRLSYDDLSKRLSFAGVLDPAAAAAIDAAATGEPALAAAVARLAAANQQVVGPFFTAYPELRALYAAYVASADPVQARRAALLGSFLPILKQRRKQEQALASITSASGADPSFASALLADPAVLHSDTDMTTPAITDLVAVEQPGLSARFFLGNDLTAAPDQAAEYVPALSYPQTVTVGGAITAGDVVTITINGVAIPHAVGAADTTTALLAAGIAAAVNAATAADPVTTLPVNQVVSATASANVITIAGLDPSGATSFFSLAAAVSAGATETCAAGSQLPAGHGGGGIAGVWSGYLTVPQDGFYDINVAADPGADITLRIGAAGVPGVMAGSLWSNSGPIQLVAGQLVPITLTASSIRTTLSVSWRSLGIGWQPVPGACLYSSDGVTSLRSTYVRFLKATALAAALSLTAAETAYLGTAPDIDPGWLSLLTVSQDPDPATAARLTAVLTALLDFARMKQSLSPVDSRLLAVLMNPLATLPNGQTALLSLTGWAQDSVNALLTQFFGSTSPASLSGVENLRRVYDAQEIVRTCGLTASALISAITNAPCGATVSALQSALRARYADSDWLTVIGPINDQARIRQRDALVAYILQRLGDSYARSLVSQTTSADAATGASVLTCTGTAGVAAGMAVQGAGIAPGTVVTAVAGDAVTISNGILAALPAGSPLLFVPGSTVAFDTPDSLFEYFLIDTQTQPAVRTSRVRLALSSVQLFVERVVRNLEPQVAPASIDSAQWAWMKRYRVWQANREVFLWPENWLYPELRDDQSPLFQQMMSSLLQGDITDDAAASAYLDYLASLEEVAKLEPCGMYYQPGTADTDETSYVVARTAGAHRKHYFRELANGSWTPWTEVKIDCEDMTITPVVWNGRLFLFWLKALKQAQPRLADLSAASSAVQNDQIASLEMSDLLSFSQASANSAGQGSVQVRAILCWTEFYNGKWQPTRTSDVKTPTTIGYFDHTGPGSFEASRDLIRIVPAGFTGTNPIAQTLLVRFSQPAGTLMLAITVASQSYNSGGFVLHNTHSLPVSFDDIQPLGTFYDHSLPGVHAILFPVPLTSVLDIPSPGRTLPAAQPYTGAYAGGTFAISYEAALGDAATYANAILEYSWQPRWVDAQPGLPDAWQAPFIYEDRRHLFYVTTTENLVPIGRFAGFGILQESPGLAASAQVIPSLVLRQPVQAASPREIVAISAAGGDPAALQRYLAGGQNITAGLPSPMTISYQGQVISPVGSLSALGPRSGHEG